MSQKIHVILEDDIDGGDASETVSFALDGTNYEIDLSEKNADKLRETFAPYIGHGRKVGAGASRRGSRKSANTLGPSAREVRDWARSTGRDVPERGRIPAEIREAFDAAH